MQACVDRRQDLVSMQLALGNVARMFTREIFWLIESVDGWDTKVPLSDEVRDELEFWWGLD